MNHKNSHSLFGAVIIVAMLFSIITPGLVLAEDATPEPVVTQEPMVTEETVESQEAVQVEELSSTELVPTEETLATEVATTEATLATEPIPPIEEAADVVSDELSEVVSVMAENDAVLLDENGEPLSLASEAAQEILTNVGDPRGTLGVVRDGASKGDTFMYYKATGAAGQADGDCSYAASTLTCYFTAPLSQAVADAGNNTEIFIAPEVFTETVSINKKLKLTGDGGIATVNQFILLSGADLSGSSNVFANWVEVHSGASILG